MLPANSRTAASQTPASAGRPGPGERIKWLGDKRRMTRPQMWQQDLSACTENVLLEAVSLGLGAVWMGVAPIEERMGTVRRILELPDWLWPFNLVAIGYPRGGENGFVDRYQPSRVHFERLNG